MNWKDISYLQHGTPKQQKAFTLLTQHRILNQLAPYDPVLVSTICVDLDIASSDLDIICQNHDYLPFSKFIHGRFAHFPKFKQWHKNPNRHETVSFFYVDGVEIEIYSNNLPTTQQNAYRHLTVMSRLLAIGGDPLKSEIRQLKQSGLKTEPAFAQKLNLSGDPYQAVLALEAYSEDQLRQLLHSTT